MLSGAEPLLSQLKNAFLPMYSVLKVIGFIIVNISSYSATAEKLLSQLGMSMKCVKASLPTFSVL